MSYYALFLVIFSALMHATYNFTFKKSKIKTIYLWSMFSVSIVIMTILATFRKGFISTDTKTIGLASAAAVFFSLYQIYTGKAYALAKGDLSMVYPLSITAPLYIPFLAYFLIGERIGIRVFIGIVLALLGTYTIQLNTQLSNFRFKKLSLKEKHIPYALFAGFIYSFGSIIDKIGVGKDKFFIYTYWVVIFMFIYMTVNILKNAELKEKIFYCYRNSLPAVIAGGVILTLSFLSYRYAMEMAKISAVAGVRQISSLFGVLMGIFILKEPYGKLRFIASLLIVIGVILIKMG
ncbi:DMT family transporter [Hippea alviniae]|uniref:DMT family transporter n=1 Tax=Hippea alviniae TaxID=1279027 RepID=UPI0003B7AA35|nr:DMT family transporter [Hippea alviniae]